MLIQMVIKGDHALITAEQSVGCSITSLSFNPSHHKLAISCSLVSGRILSVLYLFSTPKHCVYSAQDVHSHTYFSKMTKGVYYLTALLHANNI